MVVVFAAIFSWVSLRTKSDAELAGRNRLVFQLQWEPGAQFVGFYVAKVRGYYAEEGITVEFLHGGPNVDPIKNLVNGSAHAGLATADQVLIWTDKNIDETKALKAVGTVFNCSLARFMSRASAPIKTPSDFVGKTVGVYPSYDTDSLLRCMLKRQGIDTVDVKIIEFPSLVNFFDGTVQAFPSYIINEPVRVRLDGTEVFLLDPADFGVTFYSDTIITTKQYYRDERETLRKFVHASARGWQFAKQNSNEAFTDMLGELRGAIGEGKPREHQRGALIEAIKHIGAGPRDLPFIMERSKWEKMDGALREIGRLQKPSQLDQMCDFDFAEAAQR